MAERIIQIFTTSSHKESIESLIEDEGVVTYWINEGENDRLYIYILVNGINMQKLVDRLQQSMDLDEDTHVLVQKIETYFPKPEDNEPEEEKEKVEKEKKEATVLREELEASLSKGAACDKHYFMLVFFSTIVAGIGMLEDNVAVVVGAMVIAPFLGPNLALTFGTAMSNYRMMKQSIKTLLLGSALAFVVGIVIGQIYPVENDSVELMSRTKVSFSSIVLALSAGAAAVLSLTQGVSSVLVGVMVAVALLPPLAASAVFAGQGQIHEAISAALLLTVNIVCINLAGLLMFILKGMGPRTWWERRQAKKAVYIASGIWVFLLITLSVVITIQRPQIIEETVLEDPLKGTVEKLAPGTP